MFVFVSLFGNYSTLRPGIRIIGAAAACLATCTQTTHAGAHVSWSNTLTVLFYLWVCVRVIPCSPAASGT